MSIAALRQSVCDVRRCCSTPTSQRLLYTSNIRLKTKKARIRIDASNVVVAAVKGSPKFVQTYLADPYVKKRYIEGYRCRSAFKLKEIDDKYQFLKPGIKCIDMGACPGSWSQVAAERIFPKSDVYEGEDSSKSNGLIVAVDLKQFHEIENVQRIVGDFTDPKIQQQIIDILTKMGGDKKADVVICDAATKATISNDQDHLSLVRLILSGSTFVFKVLRPGGLFLFKLRNGSEASRLQGTFSKFFGSVQIVKPPASRKDSTEIYFLCKNFRNK